jgi:hypothetical protein
MFRSKKTNSFELTICLPSGLQFTLNTLEKNNTLYEVKKAIEKAKGFKVD